MYQLIERIIKEEKYNAKQLTKSPSPMNSFKWLIAVAEDKEAAKEFVRAYKNGWGGGRWTPAAKSNFAKAFPNAYYSNNVGFDLGGSGTVYKTANGDIIILGAARSTRGNSTNGYSMNMSQGYIIPSV